MNLVDLFNLSFLGRREATALESGGHEFTFGDIDARSDRMARVFAARGLQPGDRLCAYLTNRVEMIDIYVACVKLGVIFVPINILYREREITHILGDSEPRAAVVSGELPGRVPVWQVDELAAAAAALPPEPGPPRACATGDSPAAIAYTSGISARLSARATSLPTIWPGVRPTAITPCAGARAT